jgi:hypothetical protein
MRLLLCLASILSLTVGCAHRPVQDLRFKTPQHRTALQRAIEAFEQYGNGVHQVDEAAGVVRSKWKDAQYSVGLSYVFYRYVATVVPNPTEASAEVHLSLEAVSCSLRDTRDPDLMASECSATEAIPEPIQQRFQRTAETFELDLSGRG